MILARRIKEGDQQALQKLIKANLRFVVSVAKQFQGNTSMTLGDLINEGNMGLIKAAVKFDETKGFKFISYAVWWIRQSIMLAVSEQSRMVRIPMNKISALNKISKTYAVLEQKFQREPSVAELSETLHLSEQALEIEMGFNGRQVSLEAPFCYNDEGSLVDVLINENVVSPDSSLIEASLKNEIQRLLTVLSTREAEVISYYFGLNGIQSLNLEEIGDVFDLTRERVRQIKERAIKRLRISSARTKLVEGYSI